MCLSSTDVTSVMEYNERLARFRQGHVNPFDRREIEGSTEGKDPPKHGVSTFIKYISTPLLKVQIITTLKNKGSLLALMVP